MIAIIAVLIALLLPAVQAAREAARRMHSAPTISNKSHSRFTITLMLTTLRLYMSIDMPREGSAAKRQRRYALVVLRDLRRSSNRQTMYNAINFSFTLEWVYSGVIIGPNPIDLHCQ